jgi:Fe-S-cluster containining protein
MALRAGHPLTVFRVPGEAKLTLNFSENGGQCPLLAADATCTAYAQRPTACHDFPESPMPGCLVWPEEAPDAR